MEAVASINDRIMQIQARIAQLDAPRPRAQVGQTTPMGSIGSVGSLTTGAPTSATAFDLIMDQALAQTAPASDVVGSGKDKVNGDGIPVELLGYGNGRIPGNALSTIAGTGHSLWSPAARSFEAMRDAAARDGVTIGITDSYRTYESQVDLAERKGLYSQGGLAARPGTSDHGWGVAMDLRLDSTAQSWIRANGATYGFTEDVPREPWHWAYRPTH
ncbi:D-alanyl-D-alanine carboxypeptidase family protein [Cellulomonas sp. KRMCY2]|uniref:M15 family metallopeptidase n=1 Tax=Cellulomonas sp. KRMCY2 TaxID=1304865 RepID=UPI00045E95E3|nr:M15 family metallopeptidase [Cellulomonas sp. KRMCY2]